MRKLRKLDDLEEDYLRQHPEEIDEYLTVLFDEYADDGDLGALLASLRVISRVKGVGVIAEKAGLSRKGLQKALSENGNPKFESINAILHALGYCLNPQRLRVV